MGCMNSKSITTRSMSIRQDLNDRFHRTSVALEEILTSHSGKNKLFAFVQATSNSTSSKTGNNSGFQSTTEQPKTTADSNNLLSEKIDLLTEKLNQTREPDLGSFTRSKSYNTSRETELEGLDENKLEYWKNKKSLMGSRSFHTLEEFDAMLERINRSNTSTESPKESKSLTEDPSGERGHKSTSVKDPQNLKGSESKNLSDNPSGERGHKRTNVKDPQNLEGSSSLRNWVDSDDTVRENGLKRKAIAKRLQSLDVSTVEFPVIEGVKQLKHEEEQVYTPKFGNYNNPKVSPVRSRGKTGETNFEFCAELVAALEDCMREIQEEEESILSDIENLVEEIPSNVVH